MFYFRESMCVDHTANLQEHNQAVQPSTHPSGVLLNRTWHVLAHHQKGSKP